MQPDLVSECDTLGVARLEICLPDLLQHGDPRQPQLLLPRLAPHSPAIIQSNQKYKTYFGLMDTPFKRVHIYDHTIERILFLSNNISQLCSVWNAMIKVSKTALKEMSFQNLRLKGPWTQHSR